jgi:hypothetical protein
MHSLYQHCFDQLQLWLSLHQEEVGDGGKEEWNHLLHHWMTKIKFLM